MKFINLIKSDFYNGILKAYKKYIIVFFLFLLFSIEAFIAAKNIPDIIISEIVFTDIVFYCFGGMKEYIPSDTNPFIFPVIWTLIQLLLFYITLYYPFKDLDSIGQQVLVRNKSRNMWWISKSIWNFLSVSIFYLTSYLSIVIFCLVNRIPITLDVNIEFIRGSFGLIDEINVEKSELTTLLLAIYLLPFLISVSLNSLQMTISLYVKPFASFCISSIIILICAYCMHPLLIGNYSMPIRSNLILNNGMDLLTGVAIATGVLLISFVLGLFKFKHYDIINRE